MELRRIRKIIFWALDDYFVYGYKEKSLEQIVAEDMGLALEIGGE